MSQALATELNRELDSAAAEVVIERALDIFGDRFALVSSFGAESGALLALAADVSKDIPVLFLDTSFHFAQTLQHRDTLIETLGLRRVTSLRAQTADIQAEDPRSDLWKRSTDACCDLRKVRPLDEALLGYDAWGTGRKRWQNALRSTLETVEWDGERIKINPLARWSATDIVAFSAARKLPLHPLFEMGYRSIGCWPCTKATSIDQDQRAGRWADENKTECGIHLARPTARTTHELVTAL